MTDELTVQAVNPQVKRKDNTMPYTLGGAAVGAAAGGLSPIGVTKQKYSSYEDILKESKDTFETNINKGGDNKSFWETAKQHKEAVDKAGEEWEAKVKEIKESHKSAAGALPADHEVAKNLKTAQEAYDTAFEAEKNKVSSSSGKKVVNSFLKPNEALEHGAFKDPAVQAEYTRLYNNYETALNNAEKGSKSAKAIESFQNEVNDYFKGLRKKAEKLNDAGKKDIDGLVKIIKDNNIITIEPEVTNFSDYAEKGYKSEKAYKKAYKAERNAYLKTIEEKRNALAKEILGEQKEVTVKVGGKDKTIKVFANAYGDMNSYNRRANTFKDINKDIAARIKNKGSITDPITGNDVKSIADLKTVAEYDTEINKLKGKSGSAIDKQRSILNTLKDFAQRKETADKKFVDSTKNFFDGLSRVKELNVEKQAEIAKAVKTERGQLMGYIHKKGNDKLKDLMSTTTTTLSDSEIADKALKNLEGKDVTKTLEAAKKAAEEEAKKLGLTAKELTDDELAKVLKDKGLAATKEEACTKAKTAAKEALEKDLSKIKGPNRWVNAAIAGLVLAGVGYGIASSKKN